MALRLGDLIRPGEAEGFAGAGAGGMGSAEGGMGVDVGGVCADSRTLQPGDLFFCVDGYEADGHRFACDALSRGAAAVVAQKELAPEAAARAAASGTPVVRVASTRRALALASSRFYGEPSREFSLVGVTGTKGKTTATYMMRSIAEAAGIATGLVGTIERCVGGESEPARETTPGPVELQRLFARMAGSGARFAAIEVSSQGLAQDRVAGCDFDVGVFTNLYRDHIAPREHKGMEDYLAAKLRLFSMCRHAVANQDAPEFGDVCRVARAAGAKVYGFRVEGQPRGQGEGWDTTAVAKNVRLTRDAARIGVAFEVSSPWFSGEAWIGMPGAHNVYNALTAIAACGLCGIGADAIREGLARARVKGRAEMVDAGQGFAVVVDYAHNAASLESLLAMARGYGFERVSTVFGCGGDRAPGRRRSMGEASGRLSDFTVITSDNPRSEEPSKIMADIEAGVARAGGRYVMIEDRKEAIAYALAQAAPGSAVLIAGKGHETTQTFKDRCVHFDDSKVALECLEAASKGRGM